MNQGITAKVWHEEWFDSPYYRRLYADQTEKKPESIIEKLISRVDPPAGSRILDINCGKGHLSKMLAEKGFHVTGIDISERSIGYARQSERDNLEFFQHDMRLPFRINYYDYTFNLFSGFGYFRTGRDYNDFFRTVASGLKPKGVFVIDYLNVHYAEDHIVQKEEKVIDNIVYEIHSWHDENNFFRKIRVNGASLSQPEEYTEQAAKFSFGDFNDMLSYEGMQVMEVFGDYDMNSYDVRKTPRLIILAEKK